MRHYMKRIFYLIYLICLVFLVVLVEVVNFTSRALTGKRAINRFQL